MKALLWLLLLSSEIVSTPIAPRNDLLPLGAPAIAMARDSEGVVIAWAARNDRGLNRINVARLDASAQLVGSVHVLPADDAADASALSSNSAQYRCGSDGPNARSPDAGDAGHRRGGATKRAARQNRNPPGWW